MSEETFGESTKVTVELTNSQKSLVAQLTQVGLSTHEKYKGKMVYQLSFADLCEALGFNSMAEMLKPIVEKDNKLEKYSMAPSLFEFTKGCLQVVEGIQGDPFALRAIAKAFNITRAD